MRQPASIGAAPWPRAEIVDALDEFCALYSERPIRDNRGGMLAPHMFAVWFMARKLSPDLVVESGVWKGQSTWLLERACPKARLISIDVNLANRVYISPTATYSDRDFSEQDWPSLPVTDRALAFFDDHQNACLRLQQCRWFGFRHVIFDDNYPGGHGDCYSLKKAFAGAGFEPAPSPPRPAAGAGLGERIRRRAADLLGVAPMAPTPRYAGARIAPNDIDARVLQRQLEIYWEFPPVFRTARTRWGAEWSDASYPTAEPLLDRVSRPAQQLFLDEADSYTWICYARLRGGADARPGGDPPA